MKLRKLRVLIVVAGFGIVSRATWATDLMLRLNGSQPVSRQTVRYRCDARGASLGLPAGVFAVRYVNGAGNSLAVVRVHGIDTVMANVVSADGARYAAGPYVWWQARETSFSSMAQGGEARSVCTEVK